jgi:hypothetical protein
MAKTFYSPEETAKKFEALPQAIKDLLYSFEMISIITKVGEKNGLHVDQMDALNTETAYVMMGLTETKDFPEIIAEDLGIDQTKAGTIASDINEMLFSKVRAAMQNPSAVAASNAAALPIQKPSLADVLPKTTPASVPVPMSASVAPISTPVPATPVTPVAPLVPEIKIDMHPADIVLTKKTVAMPPAPASSPMPAAYAAQKTVDTKAVPPNPTDYKADPYREPVN